MPKLTPSSTKLRGGFYTPPEMATFLAEWAITPTSRSVLEPSAGDGAFFDGVAKAAERPQDGAVRVTACELDREESIKARARLKSLGLEGIVIEGDFFASVKGDLTGQLFDAVVGNPPFLRFQYFPEPSRERAFALMRALGMRPNRLTNAWVPFVALATSMCAPGGRVAMVVPAELLQVSYAAQLRQFLADQFGEVTLVTFKRLVFAGVEQEVVLLLGDKSARRGGIRVLELNDLADLNDPQLLRRASPGLPLDHSEDKWTQYFLSEREFAVARAVLRSGGRQLGDVAEVDVGVVTGHNAFFLLNSDSGLGLKTRHLDRVIHRGAQLRGLSTNAEDWESSGGGKLLLAIKDDEEIDEPLRLYLEDGVSRGVPLGYKCRIRRNWWVVPSRSRPDAFLLRQIHLAPRLSLNAVKATSTDTVHRVRFRPEVDRLEVVAAFHSSATFALAELLGRSYGGGVLELEPSEAERLPVARLAGPTPSERIDGLLRLGDVSAVALAVDANVAPTSEFGPDDLRVLHGAWQRLRDRRMKRGQSSRHATPLADIA